MGGAVAPLAINNRRNWNTEMMKRLMTTAAALTMLATAAQAKDYVFYQGKYWQTFGTTSNSEGQPMCGMAYTAPNGAFYVKWTPEIGLGVHAMKLNWKLPATAKVAMVLRFYDKAKPGAVEEFSTAAGFISGGKNVMATIKADNSLEVIRLFAAADRLVISYPNGDEPDWVLPMVGSRNATEAFSRCVGDIRAAVAPTSPSAPSASPAKPTSPAKPGKAAVADDGSV